MNRRSRAPGARAFARLSYAPIVLCCVIRIRTDLLSPGYIPVYGFSPPLREVFVLNTDGNNVLSIQNKRRVTVPEFEIGAVHCDSETAQRILRLKIANKLATLCVAMGVEDGVVLVPSRGIMVVGGSSRELNAYTYIGMMLTEDWDPDEPETSPDASLMLPGAVHDIREFGRDIDNYMAVFDVMEA